MFTNMRFTGVTLIVQTCIKCKNREKLLRSLKVTNKGIFWNSNVHQLSAWVSMKCWSGCKWNMSALHKTGRKKWRVEISPQTVTMTKPLNHKLSCNDFFFDGLLPPANVGGFLSKKAKSFHFVEKLPQHFVIEFSWPKQGKNWRKR